MSRSNTGKQNHSDVTVRQDGLPIALRFAAFEVGQADIEKAVKADAAEERARLEGLWRTLMRGAMTPSAEIGRSAHEQAL